MRVTMNLSADQLRNFNYACEAAISKVGNGSRKSLVQACRDISEASLNEVPVDTSTLALSQFWEVNGNYKTGWDATIGYGGNGDPVNPKTGRKASSYMVAVHEDLAARHPHGKAKFLEDPIREYAKERFPRTVIRNINNELSK